VELEIGGGTDLVRGGVVDPLGMVVLRRGLKDGGVRFHKGDVHGDGDAHAVGELLWEWAAGSTDESFLEGRLTFHVKTKKSISRARKMDLAEGTRRYLVAARFAEPIGRVLMELGVEFEDVAEDLEALHLMGLIAFQRGEKADGPAAVPDAGVTQAQMEMAANDPAHVRKRLEQEWSVVEAADALSVLQIRTADDPAQMRVAMERFSKRYTQWLSADQPAEVRTLAQKLVARVESASKEVMGLIAVYEEFGLPGNLDTPHEQRFRLGFLALQAGDAEPAARHFEAAMQGDVNNSMFMAFCGYAQLKSEPGEAGLQEATELLLIAESLNRRSRTIQVFLAHVDHEAGRWEAAEERLQQVIKRGGASEDTRSLYFKVRSSLRAQS
jgi:tetratricopeptide (TPR) repeat protein